VTNGFAVLVHRSVHQKLNRVISVQLRRSVRALTLRALPVMYNKKDQNLKAKTTELKVKPKFHNFER